MYIFSLYKNTRSSFSLHCGKVLSFPQFSGSAPAPEPPGTRPFAEEETASALLPRSLRFLKKEMKFLLTNEKLRSSSSAGKNGKAPRPVFLAKRYRLAWKLRRRFRPLASDYTIFSSPQGEKSSCHCRNPFLLRRHLRNTPAGLQNLAVSGNL